VKVVKANPANEMACHRIIAIMGTFVFVIAIVMVIIQQVE